MADNKSTHQSASNSPRFSAGLVTAIITAVFLIAFGAIMIYGIGGIQQHDNIVVGSQAE